MIIDLDAILGEKGQHCPREYHIMVSHHSHPVSHSGDSGFYMLADDVSQARATAEKLYPPSEYTIIQIKQIR